jgi:hypothetical protein
VTLGPRARRGLLAVHLLCSCGWIGMVIGYLALGVTAATSSQPEDIRAAWIAMEVTGWSVLLPLALGSLLTGVVLALGTRWGLLRHYWVLFALVMTLLSTVVLVVHLPSVSRTADVARAAEPQVLAELGGDLVHPAAGLLVLLLVLVLNVYKPPGLTPYGWRTRKVRDSGD